MRRNSSLRNGSALEPQRLSRSRFPLGTPFGVTGPMKARSSPAVRNFLPRRACDKRLAAAQTGGERIGDEAIPNPGVDLLTLATDGGGLRFRHNRQSFHRRWSSRLGLGSDRRSMLDQHRRRRHFALDRIAAATAILRNRKSPPVPLEQLRRRFVFRTVPSFASKR